MGQTLQKKSLLSIWPREGAPGLCIIIETSPPDDRYVVTGIQFHENGMLRFDLQPLAAAISREFANAMLMSAMDALALADRYHNEHVTFGEKKHINPDFTEG